MSRELYQNRIKRCVHLMQAAGLDAMVLTKPANMFYLLGDGRLCAYAMISAKGEVALGVPVTDLEDVKQLAHFDYINGFDDEVGMIHSIAHNFSRFGIAEGVVGLEYAFFTPAQDGHADPPSRKARSGLNG